MRKDLFWHVACGTSSSQKAAYALASAMSQLSARGMVLHTEGIPIRNVVICFARLAHVPSGRDLIDHDTALRRPSVISGEAADTWTAPVRERYGVDISCDKPPDQAEPQEGEPAGLVGCWWVALYTERRVPTPVESGQLVRVGGPAGFLATVLASDDVQCSVEARNGAVHTVPRSECTAVERRLMHINLHGPAYGAFSYRRTSEGAPDVPLHLFTTPEPPHTGPAGEGAPFRLKGIEGTPRFLKKARAFWVLPIKHYLGQRSDLGYEVLTYVSSIVEPFVDARFRKTLSHAGLRVAVRATGDPHLDGRQGAIERPLVEGSEASVGVRLDGIDGIVDVLPSQLCISIDMAPQLLTYDEMRADTAEPSQSTGDAETRERTHLAAEVRNRIAVERMPWHEAENPRWIRGLEELFETGWFDPPGETSAEHREYRKYYADFILFTKHPCFTESVELAKRHDPRYYSRVVGLGPPDKTQEHSDMDSLQGNELLCVFWQYLVAHRFVCFNAAGADAGALYKKMLDHDIKERKAPILRFLTWMEQQQASLKPAVACPRENKVKRPQGYGNAALPNPQD